LWMFQPLKLLQRVILLQVKVDVQMFGRTRQGSALQSNITVRQAAVVSIHGLAR